MWNSLNKGHGESCSWHYMPSACCRKASRDKQFYSCFNVIVLQYILESCLTESLQNGTQTLYIFQSSLSWYECYLEWCVWVSKHIILLCYILIFFFNFSVQNLCHLVNGTECCKLFSDGTCWLYRLLHHPTCIKVIDITKKTSSCNVIGKYTNYSVMYFCTFWFLHLLFQCILVFPNIYLSIYIFDTLSPHGNPP